MRDKSIAGRIRELRKSTGWKQKEWSEKTGIPLGSMINIELSVNPLPKEDKLRHICAVTGARYNWLMTGEGLMRDHLPLTDENIKRARESVKALVDKYRDGGKESTAEVVKAPINIPENKEQQADTDLPPISRMAVKTTEIYELSDNGRLANITMLHGEFGYCKVEGIGAQWNYDDWQFLGAVSREIERLVKAG